MKLHRMLHKYVIYGEHDYFHTILIQNLKFDRTISIPTKIFSFSKKTPKNKTKLLNQEAFKVTIYLYLPKCPEYLWLFLHHLILLHLQKILKLKSP